MTAPGRVCAVCGRDIRHRGENTVYCHRTCRDKAKRQRNRAIFKAPLLPPPPPTHCERCGKLACVTEQAARLAKRDVEARTGHRDEVRYYECPEGFWHWTRMDATLDGYRARSAS